jgi:hypothetical protein
MRMIRVRRAPGFCNSPGLRVAAPGMSTKERRSTTYCPFWKPLRGFAVMGIGFEGEFIPAVRAAKCAFDHIRPAGIILHIRQVCKRSSRLPPGCAVAAGIWSTPPWIQIVVSGSGKCNSYRSSSISFPADFTALQAGEQFFKVMPGNFFQ